MKKFILFILGLYSTSVSLAQIMPLHTAPDGGNKKALIGEQIGIVKINIHYNRPGVKGREGQIWGTHVAHYGLKDLGHGTCYAAPWRAGANENTTFSFSHPVQVEGKDLPAGTYGFFIINDEKESTLIFSKNSTSWGSFYYKPEDDALRVTVKNQSLERSEEWLKYEFTDQTDSSAIVSLSWEKRIIPFRISARIHELQIAEFKKDLLTTRPPDDFVQAASYCLANNIELEQALAWIDRGIHFRIMGQKTFRTLSTKAALLKKMNREVEADKIMLEALPLGSMTDVHFYGRRLLSAKKTEDALKVFQDNYDKYPNQYTTNMGMARAFSALGNYKKALEFVKRALPLAPDAANKASVEQSIIKLEKGLDINTN